MAFFKRKRKLRKKKRTDSEAIIGNVEFHREIYSRIMDIKRDFFVWLPPGYDENVSRRYPVLYMHDGQNLIHPKTAYAGKDWQVDETVTQLIKEYKIKEIIVVGIYNNENRLDEYNGPKKHVKFYIDHGEDGLIRGQRMFCKLTQLGYVIGTDLDYFYVRGAEHNETEWAKRLERPLIFFFGK